MANLKFSKLNEKNSIVFSFEGQTYKTIQEPFSAKGNKIIATAINELNQVFVATWTATEVGERLLSEKDSPLSVERMGNQVLK